MTRSRADTITVTTATTLDNDSSFPPSPTSISSLTPSSTQLIFKDNTLEYSFTDIPPQPTNTPSLPSPPPHRIMQLENIPEFSGTQEDSIQPSDFLKMVKHSFLATGMTSDSQKINRFELYLKSNSLAEEWYNDAKTPKKVWAELELEFKKRFLNVKKAMKMTPELEGAMRVMIEELGKTEKYKGEEVYTHMIFAKKILNLAKCMKIETPPVGFGA